MTATPGSLDLSLHATRLGSAAALSAAEHELLRERAEHQLDMPGHAMVGAQVLRLAVASALEARLLHVARHRLNAFSLRTRTDAVTLVQMAALQRYHHGTAGQAFELAVADAVQAGDPTVVEPIVEGLRLLNIPPPSTLDMMVLGLEKVRPEEAEGFYGALTRMLPDDAVLRTGAPGRPANMQTAVMKLKQATWTNMNDTSAHHNRADASQLGRADALLVADSTAVAVSMKINNYAVNRQDGWKDVPLWITTGRYARHTQMVTLESEAGPPKVVVRLRSDRWAGAFVTALYVVDHAIADIDRHVLPRDRYVGWTWDDGWPVSFRGHAESLVRWLVKRQNLTVAEVCFELRNLSDPAARDTLLPVMEAGQVKTSVRMLAAGPVVDGFREDAEAARVVIGQPHLFFKPQPVSIYAPANGVRSTPATVGARQQTRLPAPQR